MATYNSVDPESDHEFDAEREMLKGLDNWHRWANLTCIRLQEKGVWDLVDGTRAALPDNASKYDTKVRAMETAKALRIIKQGVGPDLYDKIMDEESPKNVWATLERVSIQVGQAVIFSLVRELLNYPRLNKQQGFEKPTFQIFGEVKQIMRRLQAAVKDEQTLLDSIALVVALDSLHDDFDSVIFMILCAGDKNIDEIQQILMSAEARFRTTEVMPDFATMTRTPAKPKGHHTRQSNGGGGGGGGGKRKRRGWMNNALRPRGELSWRRTDEEPAGPLQEDQVTEASALKL